MEEKFEKIKSLSLSIDVISDSSSPLVIKEMMDFPMKVPNNISLSFRYK